jgi:hypothetical protein
VEELEQQEEGLVQSPQPNSDITSWRWKWLLEVQKPLPK